MPFALHTLKTNFNADCMKVILLFLILFSSVACSQTLTLPELIQLKNKPVYENIQVPDAQIVFPVTGLTSMKLKQEYNPMGEVKYLEIELWVIDAKGTVVYSYITTSKSLDGQIVDKDYARYMTMQGYAMLHK
jgi:hypothetical protein